MDSLLKFFSPNSKIRFAMVDVTMSAKALEARHLSGPTASMALAEGLAAVALLSMDAAQDDEATLLRIAAGGVIGGLTVEAMGDGGLRGFTNVKVLNELDGAERIETDTAWGDSGMVQIQFSLPGKLLNQASLKVSPLKVKFVLARYYNQSMQIPTACEVSVRADAGGLISARAMLAQRMEDSDMPAFVRVLEQFENGRAVELLREGASVEALGELFGLVDIEERERRDLMFKCRCSRARTLAVLKTLKRDELETMLKSGKEQAVTCHMCGQTYYATSEDIQKIMDEL